jgi:hypothetical protein
MTKQPLTRINYNIPMGLYERPVSTSEREDRPLTTIVVCALEAYMPQNVNVYITETMEAGGGMIRRVLRPERPADLSWTPTGSQISYG